MKEIDCSEGDPEIFICFEHDKRKIQGYRYSNSVMDSDLRPIFFCSFCGRMTNFVYRYFKKPNLRKDSKKERPLSRK